MRRGFQRRGGHSGGGRGRGGHHDSFGGAGSFPSNRSQTKCAPETFAIFSEFAAELDAKHDKTERLVRLSRDLTAESKRIIFLLHRVTQDREKNLDEADRRLAELP